MSTDNSNVVPATEPTVLIQYSESNHLYDGQVLSLSRADAIFKVLDERRKEERVKPGYDGSWYDKTSFRIDAIFCGEPDTYEGRQDFGDGDGGLLEHIEEYHRYYTQDKHWKAHVLSTGGQEAWEQDVAERNMILNEFLPYLKLHCNLSRMEQSARDAQRYVLENTAFEQEYFDAILAWVQSCRRMLNSGKYDLPPAPQLVTYDKGLEEYKAQVMAELQADAAELNRTVTECAANSSEAKGETL